MPDKIRASHILIDIKSRSKEEAQTAIKGIIIDLDDGIMRIVAMLHDAFHHLKFVIQAQSGDVAPKRTGARDVVREHADVEMLFS